MKWNLNEKNTGEILGENKTTTCNIEVRLDAQQE